MAILPFAAMMRRLSVAMPAVSGAVQVRMRLPPSVWVSLPNVPRVVDQTRLSFDVSVGVMTPVTVSCSFGEAVVLIASSFIATRRTVGIADAEEPPLVGTVMTTSSGRSADTKETGMLNWFDWPGLTTRSNIEFRPSNVGRGGVTKEPFCPI